MDTLYLDDFSDDELIALLQCNKLKAANNHFSKEKKLRLNSYNPPNRPKKSLPNKIFKAFSVPLTDVNNFPLILFWSAMGVVTLQALFLLLGTIILAALSFIIAALIVYTNYKEVNKSERKSRQSYKLRSLQNLAAETLLARKGLKIHAENACEFHNKHRLSMVKDSMRSGMLIATPLFGTYFLGLHTILIVFKTSMLAGILSGGAGLIIGLTLALLIGVVCACQHYQTALEEKKHLFEKKCLVDELSHKKEFAIGLTNQSITYSNNTLKSTKPLPVPPSSPRLTFKYSQTPMVFFQKNNNSGDNGPVYSIEVNKN